MMIIEIVTILQTPAGTPLVSPARSLVPPETEGQRSKDSGNAFQTYPLKHQKTNESDFEVLGDTPYRHNEEHDHEPGTLDDSLQESTCEQDGLIQANENLPKLKIPSSKISEDSEFARDTAALAAAAEQQHLVDRRTAHLASLAERADLKGLERALDAVSVQENNMHNGSHVLASAVPQSYALSQNSSQPVPDAAANGSRSPVNSTAPRLEQQHDWGHRDRPAGLSETSSSPIHRVDTPPDPRRVLMKERRAAEWRKLTIPERDAIIVLSAMCRTAARENKSAASEMYLHVGKLLALEVLVGVLTHSSHEWSQVRPEFTSQLRQPLCLALLRNCTGPTQEAIHGCTRILTTIIASKRLREGFKSEIGALYPLILLRPLEAERPEGSGQVLAALRSLSSLMSSPQVLADIFVNFDCSLQAANIFERSVRALARAAGPAGIPSLSATEAKDSRNLAVKALIDVVQSLDTWAGPLRTISNSLDGDASRDENLADGSDHSINATFGEDDTSQSIKEHLAQKALHQDIWKKLHSDKAMKESLSDGIECFNKDPVKGLTALRSSSIIKHGPDAVVEFLRNHAKALDPSSVGELLGHHDEQSIEIMHAYIDTEPSYQGLTLDVALRQLLSGFRLPGEAQKIDRIVEKFAQRYCQDNPDVFPSADAAYLLAFAIIMLNTDAHNPMADARIGGDDFVTMCMYQLDTTGEFREILPREQLLELYERIKTDELAPVGAQSSENPQSQGRSQNDTKLLTNLHSAREGKFQSRTARLAAAIGLGQLTAPFWSGATWDKQYGVHVERQRLLELTGQLLAQTPGGSHDSGGLSGTASSPIAIWHTASHSEHARPMMQVTGDAIGKAFDAYLQSCDSVSEAAPVLEAYAMAARLAALLRLEALCESFVVGLANAAGLRRPAAPGTSKEAQQVAALSRLVWLGSCSEAGSLGSAWIVIFRVLSDLEALRLSLTAPGSGIEDGLQRKGDSGTVFSRLLTKVGFSNGSTEAPRDGDGSSTSPPQAKPRGANSLRTPSGDVRASSSSSSSSLSPSSLFIRHEPGMGAVLWAETAGAGPLDRIFANSSRLDGDAVIVFFRALCAVGQSELDGGGHGSEGGDVLDQGAGVLHRLPRIHLLQRIVECTYLNAYRIRLVWHRVWRVVSQHLVSAACHHDSYVAMYAVDALRRLSDKLLCRAELAGFATQSEALRPMAAILKGSDAPAVRELAVACVAHAIHAHRKRLGVSGWRAGIEALTIAAADASPAVVTQALDALASVFSAVETIDGVGHGLVNECLGAALTAVANPSPEIGDLGTAGLLLLQTLARRMAEVSMDRSRRHKGSEMTINAEGDHSCTMQANSKAALEGMSAPRSTAAKRQTHSLENRSNIFEADDVNRRRPMTLQIASSSAESDVEMVCDVWRRILLPLAYVAKVDARPFIADASAAVLIQIFLQTPERTIPPAVWGTLFKESVRPLMSLSFSEQLDGILAEDWHQGSNEKLSEEIRTPSTATSGANIRRCPHRNGSMLVERLDALSIASFASLEGTERILRHAQTHMPDLWTLLSMPSETLVDPRTQCENTANEPSNVESDDVKGMSTSKDHNGGRSAILLPLCLEILQEYISNCNVPEASSLGNEQLNVFLQEVGPVLDPMGWNEVERTLSTLVHAACTTIDTRNRHKAFEREEAPQILSGRATFDSSSIEAHAVEEIRHACHSSMMAIRCIEDVLNRSAALIPWQTQVNLLQSLEAAVEEATRLNDSKEKRAMLQTLLQMERMLHNDSTWHQGPLVRHHGDTAADHITHAGTKAIEKDSHGVMEEPETPPSTTHHTIVEKDRGGIVERPSSSHILHLAMSAAQPCLSDTWSGNTLPALIRQETEGAQILLRALRRAALDPVAMSDGSGGSDRLSEYAQEHLIRVAVNVLRASVQRQRSTAAAAAVDEEVIVASHDGNASLHRWTESGECVMRADALRAALIALNSMPMKRWNSIQGEVFGLVAQLVCSRDLRVRKAVQQFMQNHGAAALGVETAE